MSDFKLNNDQERAVYYDGKKPLLIQAGPGAGKTRVIVERVKFLINKKNIDAESLLVITFTKKAANELKERLREDIPISTINKMQISTIHSFCHKILSENGFSGLNMLSDDEVLNMFIKKHKKDLGFEYESYISNSQISSIIDKFNEYATFRVNTEELVKYIKENNPISESYINLIEKTKNQCEDYFEFPYDEVHDDEVLKESYYNARYLAVAKAYPKYVELLNQEGYCDFNQLQIKANRLLKDDEVLGNLRYKNILIDEFQDTDPIQMEIFDSLLRNYESFTVVGDDDQSIYGFRGSLPKYFTEFSKKYDSEVVTLKTNYRSTKQIVEFNENFIKEDRVNNKKLDAVRNNDINVCYLKNTDKVNQAENVVSVIKNLKENGKIKQYSDIGILVRSLHSRSKLKVQEIIDLLDEENIPYIVKDKQDLMNYDEVRAIITLLWYMSRKNDKILSSWEKEWLNLKAFTDEYYNSSKIFNLSNETMNLLIRKEDEYENSVITAEHEVYLEVTGKKSRIKKFKGVFNRDKEILDRVFEKTKRIDISRMNRNQLMEFGITNEDDLDFFEKLYNIKEKIHDEKVEYFDKPTILQIYYKLLDTTGYLKNKFDNKTDENKKILNNLSLISNTIYNYETIINKHDLTGLLWFLNNNYDSYSSPVISEDSVNSVQIMTVHASKGLEFPVVILVSLEEDVFPRAYDIDEENKKYIAGKATYQTPDKYLEYKDVNANKQDIHEKEERRVIYVATTRAEDLLILSSIAHKDIEVPRIITKIHEKNPNFTKITPDEINHINKTSAKEKEAQEAVLSLNYSNFSEYNFCPHEYNLRYNLGFKNSENQNITHGSFAHIVLNQIHQKSLKQEISDDDIDLIFDKTLEFNNNINGENPQIPKIRNSIHNYWNYFGKNWEILASEVQFDILGDNSNLNGAIDLIIKNKDTDDITIIDFKTTNSYKVKSEILTHKQQLYIYTMALRQNPDYAKYNISKLMVFAVYDYKPVYIDIDEDEIDNLHKSIITTVQNIKNECYERDKSNCDKCEYKDTVCKMLD